MILHFVKISGLPRFSKTYHGKCPPKTIIYTNLFRGGVHQKTFKRNRCLVGPNLRFFRSSRKLRYEEIICFKDVSIYFLIFFEVFWYNESHKYGGSRAWKIEKSWKIKKMMSRIMKSGFYYTNPKRKNPIKPLNQLFKYDFTIKLPNITIVIMVLFPMIFPWFNGNPILTGDKRF